MSSLCTTLFSVEDRVSSFISPQKTLSSSTITLIKSISCASKSRPARVRALETNCRTKFTLSYARQHIELSPSFSSSAFHRSHSSTSHTRTTQSFLTIFWNRKEALANLLANTDSLWKTPKKNLGAGCMRDSFEISALKAFVTGLLVEKTVVVVAAGKRTQIRPKWLSTWPRNSS